MPSAFVPCGRHGRKRVLVAKCGKGPLLRGVEPCERAIGRVHGRRLLLRRLAKQADKQQKYKPQKAICQQPQRGHGHARDVIQSLRRALSLFGCGRRGSTQRRQAQGRRGAGHGLPDLGHEQRPQSRRRGHADAQQDGILEHARPLTFFDKTDKRFQHEPHLLPVEYRIPP